MSKSDPLHKFADAYIEAAEQSINLMREKHNMSYDDSKQPGFYGLQPGVSGDWDKVFTGNTEQQNIKGLTNGALLGAGKASDFNKPTLGQYQQQANIGMVMELQERVKWLEKKMYMILSKLDDQI